MPKSEAAPESEASAREQLKTGADAELRLLKLERKAERRLEKARAALVEDESRLREAEAQVARRREELAAAEAALRECQAKRAAGPVRAAG